MVDNTARGLAQRAYSIATNPTPMFANIKTNSTTKMTNYTITESDRAVRCDATSGAFSITLPDATTVVGIEYIIKKVDSSTNTITINTTSSQTIDFATTQTLANQYETLIVRANSVGNWSIINYAQGMMGNISRYTETLIDLGSINNATATLNLNNGRIFKMAVTGSTATIAFSNIPIGTVQTSVTLYISMSSAYTVAYPTSVKWNYGVIPTLSTTKVNQLIFVSYDNGVSWFADKVGEF